MKTVNIKGKEYVPVNEKVKYFRQAVEYKGWAIVTEHIILNQNECAIKTLIKNTEGTTIATGYAYERQDDKRSMVNSSSHVENAETSSIGRALSALSIGIDTSYASADEVEKAIKKQERQAQQPQQQAYQSNQPKTTDWTEDDKERALEIHSFLNKLCQQDINRYKETLMEMTSFKGKDGKVVAGRDDLKQLSSKRIKFLYDVKLKEMMDKDREPEEMNQEMKDEIGTIPF